MPSPLEERKGGIDTASTAEKRIPYFEAITSPQQATNTENGQLTSGRQGSSSSISQNGLSGISQGSIYQGEKKNSNELNEESDIQVTVEVTKPVILKMDSDGNNVIDR